MAVIRLTKPRPSSTITNRFTSMQLRRKQHYYNIVIGHSGKTKDCKQLFLLVCSYKNTKFQKNDLF